MLTWALSTGRWRRDAGAIRDGIAVGGPRDGRGEGIVKLIEGGRREAKGLARSHGQGRRGDRDMVEVRRRVRGRRFRRGRGRRRG